jgi:hypothetical protein
MVGVASRGSQTTYQVNFSNAGSQAATVLATFASTFADINNSRQLRLIVNQLTANILSDIIKGAEKAKGTLQSRR